MARGGTWKPYGQTIELDISGVGPGGEGTGVLEDRTYRVAGSLPQERVLARIVGRRSGYRVAELQEVLRPAAYRVAARCPVFGQCGGCAWQNAEYSAQAALLEAQTKQLLALPPDVWQPMRVADSIWHYRGKIELTFAGQPGQVMLGFNRRGRFDHIVGIDECYIGPTVNRRLIEKVRNWANRLGLEPYSQRQHSGLLRYLVVRQSSLGEWLAALVTATPSTELDFSPLIQDVEPAGSMVHVISDTWAGAVKPEASRVLCGSGRWHERLSGIDYDLSFESFFQNNVEMAQHLVDLVCQRASLRRPERVLDLFCGVGTFSLALASSARQVTGIEAVEAAVADARRNASLNRIDNARFEMGAAEDWDWTDAPPDLLLLDPPRGGLHPRLRKRLCEQPVARVIYVSCSPESLARDLAQVKEAYAVKFIQCIDMFPHTPHVETVVELEKSL